jgi:hypothetical protein
MADGLPELPEPLPVKVPVDAPLAFTPSNW